MDIATSIVVDAAELVAIQAAKGRRGVSTNAHTKANTPGAAHLSSLSTAFSLMQFAMMMADATRSFFGERSIFLVGSVPLSSLI